MTDPVNSPKHYTKGDIECIDAIRSALGDNFKHYCQGAILKYMWRYEHKGKPEEDLMKARWYMEKMIEESRRK